MVPELLYTYPPDYRWKAPSVLEANKNFGKVDEFPYTLLCWAFIFDDISY